MAAADHAGNDVALVTGGGGGVGFACAEALVVAGYRPVLLGRQGDRLEAARDRLDGDVEVIVADVTDRAGMQRAVAWVEDQVGPPLILVNAAGMAASAPLLPPDDELWRRTLDVNLTGTWIASTACLPAMRAARRGFICNIASTAALQGYAYTAAYVASKHGVLGLTRAMAEDLQGKGVRVNAICPGFLDTPMTDRTVQNIIAQTGMSAEDARETLAKMNTSGRLIRPEEVAAQMLSLLRDDRQHGASIRLD